MWSKLTCGCSVSSNCVYRGFCLLHCWVCIGNNLKRVMGLFSPVLSHNVGVRLIERLERSFFILKTKIQTPAGSVECMMNKHGAREILVKFSYLSYNNFTVYPCKHNYLNHYHNHHGNEEEMLTTVTNGIVKRIWSIIIGGQQYWIVMIINYEYEQWIHKR